jgi:hypothetical protein
MTALVSALASVPSVWVESDSLILFRTACIMMFPLGGRNAVHWNCDPAKRDKFTVLIFVSSKWHDPRVVFTGTEYASKMTRWYAVRSSKKRHLRHATTFLRTKPLVALSNLLKWARGYGGIRWRNPLLSIDVTFPEYEFAATRMPGRARSCRAGDVLPRAISSVYLYIAICYISAASLRSIRRALVPFQCME